MASRQREHEDFIEAWAALEDPGCNPPITGNIKPQVVYYTVSYMFGEMTADKEHTHEHHKAAKFATLDEAKAFAHDPRSIPGIHDVRIFAHHAWPGSREIVSAASVYKGCP